MMNASTLTQKRKAPPAANWQGRLSLIALGGLYHLGRMLQWPFGQVFWLCEGLLARLDVELMRRKGGFK